MTEQSRKKIVYVALAAAVVFGVYNFPFGRRQKPKPADQPPPQENAALTEPAPGPQIPLKEMNERPWGEDPFQRRPVMAAAEPHPPRWELSGIVFNERSPLAIINDRQVRPGEIVDNARVVEINRRSVTLD